ncbi:MAG TPA: hypothetical protein VLA98_09550, partial [Solirubrobacteraceae bacterium]|nr:hypothetical protein [Solirubrobacteraceae bacterium]
RAALLHEHLLSWLDPWLARVADLGGPAYGAWAELLTAVLRREAADLLAGDEPLPVHLRAAPAVAAPADTGGAAFLDALLAPARSGLLLVRDDLARAAGELGLGQRIADRRYVLRHLLAQDAPATLAWLEREARAAARRPAGAAPAAVRRHWRDRATATATVLAEAGAVAHTEERTHAG